MKKIIKMTLEEATEKYTKPDGTFELPHNVSIIMPQRTATSVKLGEATANMAVAGFRGDIEVRDGKTYIDGQEVDELPPGLVAPEQTANDGES